MAMRLELATFCFCSGSSSGKPYAQPSATLCAVEASMMTVSGSVHIATASMAASSGRQRMAASEGVEKLGALGGIFAIVAGERDDLDIVAAGEPVADLEAGGARLAVDKDLFLPPSLSTRLTRTWSTSGFSCATRVARGTPRPRMR